MKIKNKLLIVFLSIFTFIGLVFNGIYRTYIKNNILIKWSVHLFIGLFIFKAIYLFGKPIFYPIINIIKNLPINITIVIQDSALEVSMLLLFIVLVGLCLKFAIDEVWD